MNRILIVDDLSAYTTALAAALQSSFEVVTAASLDEAKAQTNDSIQVAVVDVRLSESDPENRDGIVYLEWMANHFPGVPIIMISAYQDFDAVVDAINKGAAYYLNKPVNLRKLRSLLTEMVERGVSAARRAELRGELDLGTL